MSKAQSHSEFWLMSMPEEFEAVGLDSVQFCPDEELESNGVEIDAVSATDGLSQNLMPKDELVEPTSAQPDDVAVEYWSLNCWDEVARFALVTPKFILNLIGVVVEVNVAVEFCDAIEEVGWS